MMTLPPWVDFERAERSAAVMARGLTGSSAAWETLLTHAQAVLGSRTNSRLPTLHESYDFAEWADLMAAARVLDISATTLGDEATEERTATAILAACAFGMSGTSVSAAAVIDAHDLLSKELSPGELVALSLSSPSLAGTVFPRLPLGSDYGTCVEKLASFMATGIESYLSETRQKLDDAIQNALLPEERYLLRLSRLSLAHAGKLSTAKALEEYKPVLPNGYVERLVADSPMLLPSQYEAIAMHGVLDRNRNLLIALPTGTGKTLLGELSLVSSLGDERGIVCYVVPYIALGRQVADRMSSHMPTEVRVHRLFGEYQAPEPLDPDMYSEVVVATPERFDAMLRLRPDLLPKITCVVFDEAHLIGNDERGIRFEGLLTRLRLLVLTNGRASKFVLLSAVLSNADALAMCIGVDPDDVIRGTWSPTAKRLMRWTEDGTLRLYAGDDPLRDDPAEVLGEAQLIWPNLDFRPARYPNEKRLQDPFALANVAYLAANEYARYGQPIMCVCSSRGKTMTLADQLVQRFPVIQPVPESIRRIINLIDTRYRYLFPLKIALQHGVAYHNASLPHDVRIGIERAVDLRELKVVAATTTLAEGVDLPFRVTIVADWLFYRGEEEVPMESLLFKNIAGRSGRAGKFTEGDTIIFDNPIGDARMTSPPHRRQLLQDEFFLAPSAPVMSSAIARVNRRQALSIIGSQLLAAIPENPGVEDLASSFHRFGFAIRTSESRAAEERINAAFRDVLDDSDGRPLAVAASPARLTSFGQAANQSGLSPLAARELRDALNALPRPGARGSDLISISVALLTSLANLPEQRSGDLRRAVASPRNRPIVRLGELDSVVRSWIQGEPFESIFASIPSKRRSKIQPPLREWLQGVPEASRWAEEFTKFLDFMNHTMEFFLPWLMRAAVHFTNLDNLPARPWSEWARFVELGVDSIVAADLITENVVVDREIARQIGLRLQERTYMPDIETERVRNLMDEVFGADLRTADRVYQWLRRRTPEANYVTISGEIRLS